MALGIFDSIRHRDFISNEIDRSVFSESLQRNDVEEWDLNEIPRDDVHVVGVHAEAVGVGEVNLEVMLTTRGFMLRSLRECLAEWRRDTV
jgi:hypothetical protein